MRPMNGSSAPLSRAPTDHGQTTRPASGAAPSRNSLAAEVPHQMSSTSVVIDAFDSHTLIPDFVPPSADATNRMRYQRPAPAFWSRNSSPAL